MYLGNIQYLRLILEWYTLINYQLMIYSKWFQTYACLYLWSSQFIKFNFNTLQLKKKTVVEHKYINIHLSKDAFSSLINLSITTYKYI